MKYTGYLISDMKTGLQLNIEPWLLPQDAFTQMDNAYLWRGSLQKREGYNLIVDTTAGNPIVGIFNYITSSGSRELLIADTKRLYKYNQNKLTCLDNTNYWTGTNKNFISYANYNSVCYMANNKDQCRKYDGTAVSTYKIDIAGGGENNVSFCRFIVVNKERVILFSVSESGTLYPQRARWCTAGNPNKWTNDEYVDCPTEGWICGIGFVRDDIIVAFDDGSTWNFEYTGDSDLPFRWKLISKEGGSIAPFGTSVISDNMIMLDYRGLKQCDLYDVKPIDTKIPDYIFQIDTQNADLVYSSRVEELRQVWLLYPELSQTASNKMLSLSYEEGNFATHDIAMSCLGFYWQEDSMSWAEESGSWSDDYGVWVTPSAHIGYPLLLAGDSGGKVYQMLYGGSDNGSDITMSVMSGQWNPYKDKGISARLGYIDFLVENNGASDMYVDLYLDFSTNHYKRASISFNGTGEKSWVRVFSGAVGKSHRISLYQKATGQPPKIHAIMPYFKPTGGPLHG